MMQSLMPVQTGATISERWLYMSSILREDQYFDNEADFCKVESESVRSELERIFLKNRISYFIKTQDQGFFERLFGTREKRSYIVRINNRDIAQAIRLLQNLQGIEIIGKEPEPDWSPNAKLQRMYEEQRLKEDGMYEEDELYEENDMV